MYTTNLNL